MRQERQKMATTYQTTRGPVTTREVRGFIRTAGAHMQQTPQSRQAAKAAMNLLALGRPESHWPLATRVFIDGRFPDKSSVALLCSADATSAAASKMSGVPVAGNRTSRSTVDPVEAFHEACIAKVRTGLPNDKAIAAVVKEHPDLHAAYLDAQRAGNGNNRPPVTTATAGAPGGSDPIAAWDAAVEAARLPSDKSPGEAIRRVAQSRPELHSKMLVAYNANRR
jgi:hypothetical protein